MSEGSGISATEIDRFSGVLQKKSAGSGHRRAKTAQHVVGGGHLGLVEAVGAGRATLMALAALFGLALAAHWSWNAFAPLVFGLPRLTFVAATGMVLFLAVVAAILAHSARHRFDSHEHHA